jgi:hypothetical protein
VSSFSTIIAEHYNSYSYLVKTCITLKQMSSQSYSVDSALLLVTWPGSSGAYVASTITYPGYGFYVGQNFQFKGTLLGGTSPANDITLSITGINASGGVNTFSVSGTGPAPAVAGTFALNLGMTTRSALRDASDMTRMLKERLIYGEKLKGTATDKVPIQGNQHRLSYLFGKLKCGDGLAGAFNLNGAISRS